MRKQCIRVSYALMLTKFKHIFRVMKLASLLGVLGVSSVFAINVESQIMRVNIEVNQEEASEVIKKIEDQTDYLFVYNNNVNLSNRVTISAKDETVAEVLDRMFDGTGIVYAMEGNNILLMNKTVSDSQQASQRKGKIINGIVVDASGIPVIGANVMVQGTTNGTITDVDGKFTLEVEKGTILKVSYIGFMDQEIPVGEQSILNITLKEDTQKLDEIIVVGYGTQRRSNMSGSISNVSSEVIESKPVTNVLSALQGEIPGMVIQRSSGQPGNETFDLNIRGASSTNGGNSPLVLIDGIPGDMNLINPTDVESISVLKDASASIYGSRAAGGVVLVTTKKGKNGAPKLTYNGNLAVTKMTGIMKAPTNYEMAIMDNEANIHNGASPLYTQDLLDRILANDPNPIDHPTQPGWKLFFTNTDWMKELLTNGIQHKHNLSISGGGERSNYYLSTSYSKQYGVVRYANDNNTMFNLRMNYDYRITNWLKLESNVSLDNKKRTDVGSNGAWVIGEAMFDMPNFPIYNANGDFFTQGGWSNAIALAKESETATFNTRMMTGNFRLLANIADGLTFTAQSGINYTNKNNEDIAKAIPLYTWDGQLNYYTGASSPEQAAVDRTTEETIYQNYTAYLNYSKTFELDHHLDAMLGVSYETEQIRMFMARRDNFISDELWELNLGGTGNMKNDANASHWATGSVFARLGYSFKNRYILETNFRYDGSSRFASHNRWRMFPGVSLGWRISQEDFWGDSDVFSELKLRASYGQTGNQEGIRLYDYIQLLKINDNIYPFGEGSQTQAIGLDVLAGVDRTWEIIENSNIGIDMAFLNSRLGISFDYFWKLNNNMLIPVTYPSILGAIPPDTNSGKLRTNGFELILNWNDKIGNVEYSASFQLSDATNKLIDYGGSDTYSLGLNKTREGYPINSYFAYVYDGPIRNQQELDEYKKLEGVPSNIGIGDAKFKDINNDGKISTYGDKEGDDGDAIYVGSTTPRFNFGLNLGAKWNNFDISLFFQGVGKRTLFREGEFSMPWSDWWRYPPQFYYGITWNEDRQDAWYPRLTHGEIRKWNYQSSTLQKVNAAYIRLKNIQIGYTLPFALLEKLGVSKTRIYLSGQDLFEIHNIKGGWDPESDTAGFNYPFQRYYSFGIDLTF